MGRKAGNAETRRAGLAGAEKLTFAPQFQVLLGDQEPVLAVAQDRQAGMAGFA
ncbi:hypothetical protein D3C84_1240450 [compost metagenome]